LYPAVRAELNKFVDMANSKIQQDIVAIDPEHIKFVNIDDSFETHCFCEPGRADPVGANDDSILFITLETTRQEPSKRSIGYIDKRNLTSTLPQNSTSLQNTTNPEDGFALTQCEVVDLNTLLAAIWAGE
jgi:hypothetical protein